MTGAGFGGCAIALVNNSKIDEFKEKVSCAYEDVTKIKPSFIQVILVKGHMLLINKI